MLKFLRKYQKWMLVIFCAGLMVAFTIQPVISLFFPEPGQETMATTYGGETITRADLMQTSQQLQMIRRLGMEPFAAFSLVPNSGRELDDALAWTLMQRAAERYNLHAGEQEAFSLVAGLVDAQDMDGLEEKAAEMGVNAATLMELGRQYLVAEQLRQLVSGVEYSKPGEDEASTGSPGLRRLQATRDALQAIERTLQQMMQQFGQQFQQLNPQMRQQLQNMAIQQVLLEQGYLDRITGHARVTANEVRGVLQRDLAEIDISVALLDAEARVDEVAVDDAYVRSIFERFAGDAPGTGEPYGLGYRVPPRVKLEAVRIPIDAAREAVAQDITPEDIRRFYNEYRPSFVQPDTTPEDGGPVPRRMTPAHRDEARVILTQVRANQKVIELAQQVRQRLNEDARGLEDDGPFKKLPDDFKPTPLVQVASEIEQEHGIAPELITVDRWTSARDINDSARFTRTWVNELPTATLRLPNPEAGILMPRPVPQAVLGGQTGLFTTIVPEFSDRRNRRGFGLASYINLAKPFVDADSPEATASLQPHLPGRVLIDETGSAYVFRITDADPAHPAEDLAPIAEKVREDAKKVKAYEVLVEQKDELLTKAADVALTALTEDLEAIKTFSGLSRQSVTQERGIPLEGVSNTGPILTEAFNTAEALVREGGLDVARAGERVFAVELAGDYKLAVVRLDNYRPMTRQAFIQRAQDPSILQATTRLTTPQDAEHPMSLEALMRYTDFAWAEGFSEDNLTGEDEGMSEDADAAADEGDAE